MSFCNRWSFSSRCLKGVSEWILLSMERIFQMVDLSFQLHERFFKIEIVFHHRESYLLKRQCADSKRCFSVFWKAGEGSTLY